MLDLSENLADIFADYADAYQCQATDEPYGEHD